MEQEKVEVREFEALIEKTKARVAELTIKDKQEEDLKNKEQKIKFDNILEKVKTVEM